jgi:hypothetical protein
VAFYDKSSLEIAHTGSQQRRIHYEKVIHYPGRSVSRRDHHNYFYQEETKL